MGYRHQFWIIAQVKGRYRTIAVQHLQNCGDTDAFHACWRLLQIFGSAKNQALLRHDLEHAARQEQDWWESNHESPAVPFPFVQTCLAAGAGFDSRLKPYPYAYPATVYDPRTSPMSMLMNNQSGSTVVDVTDARRPRYCFMFYPSHRYDKVMQRMMEEQGADWLEGYSKKERAEEKRSDLLRCRPLTAETYLTWPWLDTHEFVPYVDLTPWDLITADVLRDLWPQIPWPQQDDPVSGVEQSQKQQQRDQHVGEQAAAALPPAVPVLRDEIRHLLEDNPPEERITDLVKHRPGLSEQLHDAFCELGPEPFQRPIVRALLQHEVSRGAGTLDFSPHPWLSKSMVEQLIEAISATTDGMRRTVSSVDLSGNGCISAATVTKLLELYPNITTLTLLHTSRNLPLQLLSKVLAGRRDVELHHSELFSASFVDATEKGSEDEPYLGCLVSIPNYAASAGTLDRVLFLSTMQDVTQDHQSLRLQCGGLKWSEFLSEDDFSFSYEGENTFFHISIPLEDAFLNPLQLAAWLPRLLWYFATNGATNDKRSMRDGHASLGCALALAMDTVNDWRVGPIPATAAVRPRTERKYRPCLRSLDAFTTAGWTLLVVAEDSPDSRWYTRRCKAMRFAFVTRDPDTSALIACDPSEFYVRTTGLQCDTETKGYILDPIKDLVEDCKFDEVEEITGAFMEKRKTLVEKEEERQKQARERRKQEQERWEQAEKRKE